MKYYLLGFAPLLWSSPPVWGAWVEILSPRRTAPPATWSPPVWGAWVEIQRWTLYCQKDGVAPRVGGVG